MKAVNFKLRFGGFTLPERFFVVQARKFQYT